MPEEVHRMHLHTEPLQTSVEIKHVTSLCGRQAYLQRRVYFSP